MTKGERVIRQWLKEDSSLLWRVEPRADLESAKPVSVTEKHEETDRRPVERTARTPPDRVGQKRSTNPPAPRSERRRASERAQRLLLDQLANGPKPGALIEAAAEAAEISERALVAAADVLGVRTLKGQWWLPGSCRERTQISRGRRARPAFNPWHVDSYARGREATAPAGNEARK